LEKLVAGLKRGDDKAFEEFVSQYEKTVYSIACRILGNTHDAEDASQEVFLRVYRHISRFREDSSLSTWVYQITVNVCYDMTRRKKRHPQISLTAQDEDGEEIQTEIPDTDERYQPEAYAQRREMRENVHRAIDTLPEEQRQIIILRELTGLSYDEIAHILALSEGTVKSRLFRARERLSRILRSDGNKIRSETSEKENTRKTGNAEKTENAEKSAKER